MITHNWTVCKWLKDKDSHDLTWNHLSCDSDSDDEDGIVALTEEKLDIQPEPKIRRAHSEEPKIRRAHSEVPTGKRRHRKGARSFRRCELNRSLSELGLGSKTVAQWLENKDSDDETWWSLIGLKNTLSSDDHKERKVDVKSTGHTHNDGPCTEKDIDNPLIGGPLCKDPYSEKLQAIVYKLTKEAVKDETLCFENFRIPCPPLTSKQITQCKGFDYTEKRKKLPMGSLMLPAGWPRAGYKIKQKLFEGRYISVALKNPKAAPKPATYLKITQNGDVTTFDASVNMFARAKRTWKSGHWMYEPLQNGVNLLGAWRIGSDNLLVGFFWSMELGRCLRIERRIVKSDGFTFLRQATEIKKGLIVFSFLVKVSNHPSSTPYPVQSRDYTALAGAKKVWDTAGNVYPCDGVDLDPLVLRDRIDKFGNNIIEPTSSVIERPSSTIHSTSTVQVEESKTECGKQTMIKKTSSKPASIFQRKPCFFGSSKQDLVDTDEEALDTDCCLTSGLSSYM